MAKEPLYPHVPGKKGPLFPHTSSRAEKPSQDAAYWWDSEFIVVKYHTLLELGADRTLVEKRLSEMPRDVSSKIQEYYSRYSKQLAGEPGPYLGGWKAGDKAIYTDFGLRSLYIVEVLPPRITKEGESSVPGEMAGGMGVLAKIIDTSLVDWDFSWHGRVEPWNQVGTIHQYNYTNLYRTIEDLIGFEGRITYWHIQQALIDALREPEHWSVLIEYGLAKLTPVPPIFE
ncbi:hypothetical protein ES705_33734 [subsurface metagenome]